MALGRMPGKGPCVLTLSCLVSLLLLVICMLLLVFKMPPSGGYPSCVSKDGLDCLDLLVLLLCVLLLGLLLLGLVVVLLLRQ